MQLMQGVQIMQVIVVWTIQLWKAPEAVSETSFQNERFGFYPVRRMTLVAEKGDEEGSVPMDKGYAMYRPAKGKKITDIHQVIDCSVPTASTIETQVMDREGSEIL